MSFLKYIFYINHVYQKIEPSTDGIHLVTIGYYKQEIVYYSKIDIDELKLGMKAKEYSKAEEKIRLISIKMRGGLK